VAKTMSMKDFLVGGKIDYIKRPEETPVRRYRKTPIETRDLFKKAGWKTIVAFQTRNVPHVAHEMLQKASLNTHDGLFINPLIGKKKSGDYKDEVIVASYETLIKYYYPQNLCGTKRSHSSCYNEKELWMYKYYHRQGSCRCRKLL
jgi:sulfate adenylyltransferase